MSNITIATCAEQPQILPSDVYLATALEKRGHKVIGAPWNGAFAPFANADMVIIRSTWDYFDRLTQFYAWLDKLEAAPCHVENALPILRWNAQKEYLFELQTEGITLVPTQRVAFDIDSIITTAKQHDWHKYVLKCLSSGGAKGMSLISGFERCDIEQALEVAKPYAEQGLMLQEFLPEIQTSGELSILFFGGIYSHTIHKMPQQGEIRVQSEFGGIYTCVDPDAATLKTAQKVIEVVKSITQQTPTYARVDGVIRNNQFLLMEVELTEPELMLHLAEGAAEKLANLIETKL